MKNEVK